MFTECQTNQSDSNPHFLPPGFAKPSRSLPLYSPDPQPVVFDAAYKPALTSLLAQAKEAQCPYVQGADMLVEQGLEQFQLWTERRAPREEMEGAVFAKVDRI